MNDLREHLSRAEHMEPNATQSCVQIVKKIYTLLIDMH